MLGLVLININAGDAGTCGQDCRGLSWQFDTEPYRIWPECSIFRTILQTKNMDDGKFAVRCQDCFDAANAAAMLVKGDS